MEMSPTIAELAKALCKAQLAMPTAKKDSKNPHFNSKYADIASCWEACRKPLSDNGLSVSQYPETDGTGKISLTTVLLHNSGEWMRGTLSITPKDGSNPQVFGSIVTYFRRYGLQSAVGIASDEDDDGNAGAGAATKATPAKAPPKTVEAKVADPATPPAVETQPPPPPATDEKKDVHTLMNELQQLAEIAVDAGKYPAIRDAIFAWTSYKDKKTNATKGFLAVTSLKQEWQLTSAITRANADLNAKQGSSLDEPKDDDIVF